MTDVAVALIQWLAHVGLAAVQALAWFGLGWLALRRLRTGERALDALNAIGAGAVGFALLTFALGLMGLLYTAPILAATLAAAAGGSLVALRAARRLNARALVDRPRWQLAVIAVLAATALLGAVATGAPVNGFDALAYHVSVPVVYEEQHEVVELPWSWHSYQPFTVEMLITDGLLLWDTVQGAFASFSLVVAATAAVVVGGRLVGGTPLGLVAGAIFATQPLVAWEATAALIDGGIAFASALASLNVLVWARTARGAPLVLAGAFAGAAAGMKYVGLFVALAVGLSVVLIAGSRLRASTLAAVAVPGALVALPWYAKNWALTGNPLFPFVFGGLSESAQNGIEDVVGGYGYGRTPRDALLLPVRLVTDSQAFDGADWLSPLVLVFPLLALLDRSRRRGVAIALACCGFFLGCWFLTSQQARFLIPMLPVLSVLAALGVAAIVRVGRAGRALAIAATAATVCFGLAVFTVYCLQFVPVVAGVESRESFLSDRTAFYDGITWLNRRLGDEEAVLIDFASPYLEPRWVLWSVLTFPTDGEGEDVRRVARENGMRFAAVLEANEPSRRSRLADLRARRIAAIDVHTAHLGLRRWGGVPHKLLVYELDPA